MLICRNAEGVHGQIKVTNPWFKTSKRLNLKLSRNASWFSV